MIMMPPLQGERVGAPPSNDEREERLNRREQDEIVRWRTKGLAIEIDLDRLRSGMMMSAMGMDARLRESEGVKITPRSVQVIWGQAAGSAPITRGIKEDQLGRRIEDTFRSAKKKGKGVYVVSPIELSVYLGTKRMIAEMEKDPIAAAMSGEPQPPGTFLMERIKARSLVLGQGYNAPQFEKSYYTVALWVDPTGLRCQVKHMMTLAVGAQGGSYMDPKPEQYEAYKSVLMKCMGTALKEANEKMALIRSTR